MGSTLSKCMLSLVFICAIADDVDDLWTRIGGAWKPIVEKWHGLGACHQNSSLIFGLPDETCIRKLCLISSTGQLIDLNKLLISSDPEEVLYTGSSVDCYPPKNGQVKLGNINETTLSYIFTVHNNDNVAAKAILEAYRTAHEVPNVEIVVLDDGSNPELTAVNRLLDQLTSLFGADINRLPPHLVGEGYIESNNQALSIAKGEYAVLLNTDVQVIPGWISLMLRTIQTYPGK